MAAPETSDPTSARLEQSSTEEAEGNDLEINFVKVIETLKEEMRNYLEEMEGKTNKELEKYQ